MNYGKRSGYIVLMMLFVEEIEFWVMHYSVESIENEFFHVEEEEELPDHSPGVGTSLHCHENIESEQGIGIDDSDPEKKVRGSDPDTISNKNRPFFIVLFPGPKQILFYFKFTASALNC